MLWFLKMLRVKQNECTLYTKQGLLWRQMHIQCKGLPILCNDGIFLFVAVLLQLHLAVCRLWLQCFHHSWESLETPASDISMNLFQYGIFEVIMMCVFCTFSWYRPSDIIIEWYPVAEQFTNHNTDLNILMFLNAHMWRTNSFTTRFLSKVFSRGLDVFVLTRAKRIHPQLY